jgi:hypothetical protein
VALLLHEADLGYLVRLFVEVTVVANANLGLLLEVVFLFIITRRAVRFVTNNRNLFLLDEQIMSIA